MDVPPGLSHDGAAGDGRRRIPHDNGWLSSLASLHPIQRGQRLSIRPTYLFRCTEDASQETPTEREEEEA